MLETDVMFEFLALCYKPWLAKPTDCPTNRWAWRANRGIAASMVVQDDGVYYVLTKMLVRNVPGHFDRATAAQVRHRPPGGAHARARRPSAHPTPRIIATRVAFVPRPRLPACAGAASVPANPPL